MATPKYSIIIPCYNEIENLDMLIEMLSNEFNGSNAEFIIVENGSIDGSKEWLNNCKKVDGMLIKVCYITQNRGYGFGIIKGMENSSGNYIGWIHADFQISPLELKKFFDYIEKHNNPSKLLLKGMRQNRHIAERFFSLGMSVIMTLLLKRKMRDINAVPVLIDESFKEECIMTAPYELDFDLYVYYLALMNGYRVERINVSYNERNAGSSSWNAGIKSQIKASYKLIRKAVLIRERKQR